MRRVFVKGTYLCGREREEEKGEEKMHPHAEPHRLHYCLREGVEGRGYFQSFIRSYANASIE